MKINTNIRKRFRVSNKVKKVAPKDRFSDIICFKK